MSGLETVDFLLTKAARLDKALKSLPKADRKTLHTSSHKRARKLLRNLSFPAKVSELTDENIENQIDVLTTVKSSVVSFTKKMPPLSDALTVGPDAMAVRACALEAREGLAEDLCSEEISKTGASLDCDMGAAKIIEAAFSGEHLETVTLSGLTLSYRSVLALYTALRQNRLGSSLRHLTLAACGLGGDLELMPPGAAAYEKGRALLESHPVDEETLARGGDVAGLLSEHLQESLRKAKLDERPALHMATATSFGSDAGEDEVEKEEEELPPPPVLLPVFHQLTLSRVLHLNLSQTWLSPSSVRALSNSLPQTQIEVIKLDECGLSDDAVEELALQGLLRSRLLLEVSLRRNQLSGNPGAISTLFHAVRIHEINIPEPAQGEEHSEVILCRAPDAKDWQVAAPPPKPMRRRDEESPTPWAPAAPPATPEKSVCPEGCWIKEARQANVKFQIPEGVSGPEQVTPEEIDDWSQGPSRIQALSDCFEEDVKIIYLKDVCHVDDEEAVKEALRSKYDLYYECYALFAGRSQWPFVRYVDMFSVFEEARVVDRTGGRKRMEKRRLHMQDIHVMITQTLANHNGGDPVTAPEAEGDRGPKKKIVPEGNPLTRPQFCEVMLRAAISWGDDLSASAAITLFADEIVAGHLLQPPLAPFPRGLAQRPGDYNDALQNSSRTLKEAWERFGYSSVAFQRLAQLVRLCDRSFTSKHVASIYTLAKVPVVDDRVSTAGDTRGLSYSEFLEAVSRLAMVWSRSGRMPACCPQEDGSMRGRRWPPQPQAGFPVKERVLAQRLQAFVQRLAERMRPSVKGRIAI